MLGARVEPCSKSLSSGACDLRGEPRKVEVEGWSVEVTRWPLRSADSVVNAAMVHQVAETDDKVDVLKKSWVYGEVNGRPFMDLSLHIGIFFPGAKAKRPGIYIQEGKFQSPFLYRY